MKKLPSINKFEFNKKINNNRVYFDSLKEDVNLDIKEEKTLKDFKNSNLSVNDKIKELINQNSYIFNTTVSLVFLEHEEICQIAGVVNNHIITMDNKIIKIKDLVDIKILEK